MSQDLKKKLAGEKAVEYIKDGMVIGLGSGSTVYWMLKMLGDRIRNGLQVKGIPSSKRTENWAMEFGVPLTSFSDVHQLDLAIDGADEVDPNLNLVKGGGGSLLREKLVDAMAETFIVIVDDSKLVTNLGKFPLPVEVVPFGWEITSKRLMSFGCKPILRVRNDKVFVTDNGNYILDCQFPMIEDSVALHHQLKQLLGVVETGLFTNMASMVIVGGPDEVQIIKK